MPDPKISGRPGETLALTLTALWTMVGVVLFLVAPQTAPVLLILGCIAPLAWYRADHGRLPWHRPSAAIVVLLGACAYLILNAAWSLSPAWGAGVAILLAGMLVAFDAAYHALRGARTAAVTAMAKGVAAGWVAGGAILLVEVLSGQILRRTVMTFVRAFRPGEGEMQIVGGWVVYVQPYLLNRSVVALMVLLWPAVLLLVLLARSLRWRLLHAAAVVPALVAAGLSAHATSKVALVGSGLVFALFWVSPAAARRATLAFWLVATLLVVPLALLAYGQQLHTWNSLAFSARERLVIWGHTAGQVSKAPLLGVGINTPRILHERQRSEAAPRALGSDIRLATSIHSHNIYLQAWYETGAVGAILLLASGLLVLRSLAGPSRRAQPYLYATFMACALIGASSFSLWQPWFLAAFGFAALFAALGAELAERLERISRRPVQSW